MPCDPDPRCGSRPGKPCQSPPRGSLRLAPMAWPLHSLSPIPAASIFPLHQQPHQKHKGQVQGVEGQVEVYSPRLQVSKCKTCVQKFANVCKFEQKLHIHIISSQFLLCTTSGMTFFVFNASLVIRSSSYSESNLSGVDCALNLLEIRLCCNEHLISLQKVHFRPAYHLRGCFIT
jgi:hypothetical protein